jgi:uncharacterized protein (DUF58 family)
MRVTRDGLVFVGLTTALTVAAWFADNPLLYLVVAPLWAVWLVQWPLGRLNLRGLDARRVLPAELYAGHPAAGRWLVVNRRRLPARSVRVCEVDGRAPAAVATVAARGSAGAPTRWSFPRRGVDTLQGVVLRSDWPFGLVEHEVRVDHPATLLVWPAPGKRRQRPSPRRRQGLAEAPRPGGGGDFLGLRAYRDGDPPRSIHWPATARLGRPMVVERAMEAERAVEVVLASRRGDAWERELSRACGAIQAATERGEAVSLRLPPDDDLDAAPLPAGRGEAWRRRLLDLLARLPHRAA